jgi:hypothetical protein
MSPRLISASETLVGSTWGNGVDLCLATDSNMLMLDIDIECLMTIQ